MTELAAATPVAPPRRGPGLIWVGAGLETIGLLLAAVSVIWFNRLTMLAFFAIGIPILALGMGCYLVVVFRYMIRKGAL